MRRDLVEKARGGDRDAFATLAAESIGRLFNIAQLMLHDRDLADDAVQETLVLVWRDLRGLRDLDGFDAWLHRVLVRSVYREANRERRPGPARCGSLAFAPGDRALRRPAAGNPSGPPMLYDPATGTFSPTGSLTRSRGGKTATRTQDGRVLIAGGHPCDDAAVGIWASAELFDPATGTFSPTGSMLVPRSSHTATLLADGRVLITGGKTGDRPVASRSVVLASYRTAATGVEDVLASAELYDPVTGQFTRTGPMSVFRDRFTATLLEDGRVLIVGGGGEGYASRTEVELYDPATGRFSPTGSVKTGRWQHTATLLQDGRVLIAGGRSPDSGTNAAAEVYDPSPGTFSAVGSMKAGRQQHTATLLQDGRVFIAGGYEQIDIGSPGQTLSSTELYDPAAGSFTPIGSMGDLRHSHAATLLADGRVLIAGGSSIGDDGIVSLTSAVLYQP